MWCKIEPDIVCLNLRCSEPETSVARVVPLDRGFTLKNYEMHCGYSIVHKLSAIM
jgi:hypothetical protein